MLKFKHVSLIVIAGLVWMVVGIFLMNVGLRLIAEKALTAAMSEGSSLLHTMASYFGGTQQAAVACIGMALAIGYFKGRFVLAKTVKKMVARIRSLPTPVGLHLIYSFKFYILIAFMIGLGMALKFFSVPEDVRGIVDIAIGAALINGAVLYFRHALELRKEQKRFS